MSRATLRCRGLFLDLDGTLVHSLPALRQAYDAFLARFGVRGSAAEFETLNGPPLATIVAHLQAAHGLPGTPDALLALYDGLVSGVHAVAPPVAGAAEILRQAQARGWTVAVVTSHRRGPSRAWLARTGLDRFVTALVGGDEVAAGKPDPAPYRLALDRTGCDEAASLAVEDSAQGAASALAAGLPTWLVGAASAGQALAGAAQFRGVLRDFAALAELI